MRLIPSNQAKLVRKVLTFAKRWGTRSQSVHVSVFESSPEHVVAMQEYLSREEIPYEIFHDKSIACHRIEIGDYPTRFDIYIFLKD